jgi:hypothetical protein
MAGCACLALTVVLTVLAAGCGNPGRGTVQVDPKVRARLGKKLGVPPADYAEAKVIDIGTKSRPRKGAATK